MCSSVSKSQELFCWCFVECHQKLAYDISSEYNCIGGVMVSVLASNAVDRGFEPRLGQTKDYTIDCVASPLSTQHYGERAKTGWLGIMGPSGATCLPVFLVN